MRNCCSIFLSSKKINQFLNNNNNNKKKKKIYKESIISREGLESNSKNAINSSF